MPRSGPVVAGAQHLRHAPMGAGILSAGFLLGILLPIRVTLLVVFAVLLLGRLHGGVYALAASLLGVVTAYRIGHR